MAGYKCPFCGDNMSLTTTTYQKTYATFADEKGYNFSNTDGNYFVIHKYRCPSCLRESYHFEGLGGEVEEKYIPLHPSVMCNQYPDYISKAIRDDYEEACSIVNLSPKASATLSRRCLQNMIRDFWGISKKRLIDEINELQGKVPATQWKVIDSLRRIGNIGAHPEADVNLIIDIDPTDAQKLIQVIELLIKQWYIERHEQEKLFADVLSIDSEKQVQRSKE